jgi:hypothetical protein
MRAAVRSIFTTVSKRWAIIGEQPIGSLASHGRAGGRFFGEVWPML